MKITLMNEGVMACRLHGIHKKIERGSSGDALKQIKETMDLLTHVYENEMEAGLTKYFHSMLQKMIVDIALDHNDMANERLRHMLFTISMVCTSVC